MEEKTGVVRPAVLRVSKQLRTSGKSGPEIETEETMEVRNFQTVPAQVSLEYGLTLNLGNYESARLTVGVTLPCYAEEVDTMYEQARGWVEERINREKADIRKASNGGGVF